VKMIFNSPANGWHESLILGNGRIGAAVYGGTKKEQIALNEDTLWSGYPVRTQKNMPEGYPGQIRELTKQKKYVQAMELTEALLSESEDTQMYVPFGNLFLEIQGEEEITEYQRELDLDTAEVVISYKNLGKKVEKRCLISEPAQLLVYRITSEAPLNVKIRTGDGCLNESRFEEGILKSSGRCPGRNHFAKSSIGHSEAVPHFSDLPEEMGIRYEGWGKVISPDGVIHVLSDGIMVDNTTSLTLCYAIRSSFAGFDKHPELGGRDFLPQLEKDLSGSNASYEQIKKEHLKEYQPYFQRVALYLKSDVSEKQDIKERLLDVQNGKTDPGLSALLFDYGRYLLISSSRPGTQAANLQGIWNAEMIPPWFSDYTININTQMNYWMTGPCNMDEMAKPLTDMCREMLFDGIKTAKSYYGYEGACAFHNTDIWRKTSPANGRAMWNFWPMGYAWLCRNLYEQYLFSMDSDYLQEIYPVLKENARFCVQAVTHTENGFVLSPATSPENEFLCAGQKVSVTEYSENQNAIVRNLLQDYLECCEHLNRHDDVEQAARRILPQMKPPAVGSHGQILEWNEELKEADIHHRHVSHLYELHPGRGIGLATPKLEMAVKNSLERRGDEGTGWSLAWKILMWARLRDGAHVQKLVNNLFHLVDSANPEDTHGGVYPNLLCAHPPYQIDGNLGYTAGVAEMLLQSHNGLIHILPALPPAWKEGKVTGLRARGGIITEIEWNSSRINVTLKSDRSQEAIVCIADGAPEKVALRAGEKINCCAAVCQMPSLSK
jgi:alpha-L-fucosidase 2